MKKKMISQLKKGFCWKEIDDNGYSYYYVITEYNDIDNHTLVILRIDNDIETLGHDALVVYNEILNSVITDESEEITLNEFNNVCEKHFSFTINIK